MKHFGLCAVAMLGLTLLLSACGSDDYRTLPDNSDAPVYRNATFHTLPTAEQNALGTLAAPTLLAHSTDTHIYVYTSDDTVEKLADFYSKQLLYRYWVPVRTETDLNDTPNMASFSFDYNNTVMDVAMIGPLTTDGMAHMAPSLQGITPGSSLLIVVTGHPTA